MDDDKDFKYNQIPGDEQLEDGAQQQQQQQGALQPVGIDEENPMQVQEEEEEEVIVTTTSIDPSTIPQHLPQTPGNADNPMIIIEDSPGNEANPIIVVDSVDNSDVDNSNSNNIDSMNSVDESPAIAPGRIDSIPEVNSPSSDDDSSDDNYAYAESFDDEYFQADDEIVHMNTGIVSENPEFNAIYDNSTDTSVNENASDEENNMDNDTNNNNVTFNINIDSTRNKSINDADDVIQEEEKEQIGEFEEPMVEVPIRMHSVPIAAPLRSLSSLPGIEEGSEREETAEFSKEMSLRSHEESDYKPAADIVAAASSSSAAAGGGVNNAADASNHASSPRSPLAAAPPPHTPPPPTSAAPTTQAEAARQLQQQQQQQQQQQRQQPKAADKSLSEQPTTKKKKKKREINPDFKDMHETGSWGNISKAEKIGIGVLIVIIIIIAIVVPINLVREKEPEQNIIVVRPDTRAPTPAPLPVSPQEKLESLLDLFITRNFTQSLSLNEYYNIYNENLPDDGVTTSYYIDLFPTNASHYSPTATDDDIGVTKKNPPYIRAMAWILFEDEWGNYDYDYDGDQNPFNDNDSINNTDIVHMWSYRYGLATFYYSTNGDEWSDNTNWLQATPNMSIPVDANHTAVDLSHICFWHGIVCDRLNTRVQEINLEMNNLRGVIPIELALLQDHLRAITLTHNSMTGRLPGLLFSNLPELFALYLANNSFTGDVPANLYNDALSFLFLQHNNLTGTFGYPYCQTQMIEYPGYGFFPLNLSIWEIKQLRASGFGIDCDEIDCYCCGTSNCFYD